MANTIKMEELLNKSEEMVETKENNDQQQIKIKSNKDDTSIKPIIPRGKPKSGRIWKSEKTKFSTIIKTKGIRNKFEKKEKLRGDLKRVKEASRAIIEARKQETLLKKQRRKDNIKRQEENRKKSEVVQVITNTSKIKRMKRKHLRKIEKRDTVNV